METLQNTRYGKRHDLLETRYRALEVSTCLSSRTGPLAGCLLTREFASQISIHKAWDLLCAGGGGQQPNTIYRTRTRWKWCSGFARVACAAALPGGSLSCGAAHAPCNHCISVRPDMLQDRDMLQHRSLAMEVLGPFPIAAAS